MLIQIVGILLIALFFNKINSINKEYMQLKDNLTVQVSDFGIMIKDLKLDKYTQDMRILKMKLWLYIEDLMKSKKKNDNHLHIVDICFSLYNEPDIHLVIYMQDVQQQINTIEENIQKGNYDEFDQDEKKEELKELKKKQINLSKRYH